MPPRREGTRRTHTPCHQEGRVQDFWLRREGSQKGGYKTNSYPTPPRREGTRRTHTPHHQEGRVQDFWLRREGSQKGGYKTNPYPTPPRREGTRRTHTPCHQEGRVQDFWLRREGSQKGGYKTNPYPMPARREGTRWTHTPYHLEGRVAPVWVAGGVREDSDHAGWTDRQAEAADQMQSTGYIHGTNIVPLAAPALTHWQNNYLPLPTTQSPGSLSQIPPSSRHRLLNTPSTVTAAKGTPRPVLPIFNLARNVQLAVSCEEDGIVQFWSGYLEISEKIASGQQLGNVWATGKQPWLGGL